VLLWSARREARFGPAGRHLEPRTFVDRRNWAVLPSRTVPPRHASKHP
jgi:hypothetical protein